MPTDMKRFPAALALALTALSPLPLAAQTPDKAPPQAGPGSEADKRFRRGIELYSEGDFHAALIEFRRAYELDPRYQALYNIGETYFQLQDYANALKTLEKYLRDGGQRISSERREEVEKELEKLRARVATVEISTPVAGVDISVDDHAAGKTPITLTVSAGRRKITASRPGKPPATQVIEVAGGDVKKVALDLHDEPSEAPKPRSVPAVPWIVTGALTAGAIVTGALALGASGDLKDEKSRRPGDAQAISAANRKTFGLALATDILAGSAVLMTGVSIYFTVAAGSPGKPAPDKAARSFGVGRAPEAKPALSFTAGPRSFALSGSF